MRDDLIALFDRGELKKYLTDEEMAALPAEAAQPALPPEAPPAATAATAGHEEK
jgi:hypothetical protein